MRLAYIDLCGFRGYQNRLRLDFADRFTIIDGRNGVGKSTIFDAVEFGLTGTIGKYREQTADRESIADYIWWTGDSQAASERYVEVGFTDGTSTFSVRRDQLHSPNKESMESLTARLCDLRQSPTNPLVQLCQSTIIRDEHITTLSMDLKETDRYALLRDALGANDAEVWISRSERLVSGARAKKESAQHDVQAATVDVASSARRLDQVRANLTTEGVIAEATARLRSFAASNAPPDELAGPVRGRMAAMSSQLEHLQLINQAWDAVDIARTQLANLEASVESCRVDLAAAELKAEELPSADALPLSSPLRAQDAQDLVMLVRIGRQRGLQAGHCPLCAAPRTDDEFEQGLQAAEELARKLDEVAARLAEQEQARQMAAETVRAATLAYKSAQEALQRAQDLVAKFDQQRHDAGLDTSATRDDVGARTAEMRKALSAAQQDLRVLETIRMNAELETASRAESDAKSRLARAQERLGRALKTETNAKAIHDAARRSAAETLDLRLERVLPLMSELYRRLRPHPVWSDIEYSIRGDVRRFLKLQVGENLNPQFLFSSGQRRATGLAFLLSVNLSLAWSRWRTILLDDPVQHVDDFRTVHLAELISQLVQSGQQIVCAVEDAALADLFCRRLPLEKIGDGKRISLGPDSLGAIGKRDERLLAPHNRNAVLPAPPQHRASTT